MAPMSREREEASRERPPHQEYERELLYGEAIETVAALLESHGITQREFARRLDRSEARVSRLLNGGENVTLKTIADVGYALGFRFALVPIPFGDRTDTPAAEDPDPPPWVEKQRCRLCSASRASAPPLEPARE